MITVIAGTNRPGSNTLKVASLVSSTIREHGETVHLIDLAELPPELFESSSYSQQPAGFAPFQRAILDADGILSVVPEYNGSFPGVLKYFIDMLRFPESLYEKPAGFIGLSAGRWGAVRSIEQLEMIFQYRHAHLYGRRVFIPDVRSVVADDGAIRDREIEERVREMARGFVRFCHRFAENPTER